ncbi:MAG: SUMF1/EgtB/PvdO family nonheme iron enzyme [bacterium]
MAGWHAADRAGPRARRRGGPGAADHRRPAGRAGTLRDEAREQLARLDIHAPDTEKAEAWRLEDEASALDREAAGSEARYLQRLQAALTLSPDLEECHDLLADHHQGHAERARERGDADAAAVHRLLVRTHDRSGRHVAWLARRGYLSLEVATPGARIALHRHRTTMRREVPEFIGFLTPPLRRHLLEAGSYLLVISAPGHADVRLPVRVEAGRDVDLCPPGAARPSPIALPAAGAIPPSMALVPGGWFLAGGDPAATDALPARRLWVDDFVMERDPVTIGAYARFLDACAAAGEDVEPLIPRDRHGPRLLQATPAGFTLLDAEPDWPVALVSWTAAVRYAAWRSAELGLACRLPHDLEWEKAARGVDGRRWPWGDHAEPGWARVAGSSAGPPSPAPVGEARSDVSVYGVRGLVGNIRDWCANTYDRRGPADATRVDPAGDDGGDPRVIRGGNWGASLVQSRPAGRYAAPAASQYLAVGFRLVASWPP